ncbi:PucR family transcriptional regulator [Cryptosporangium sp. NPDC048952]|uniref:PucR family transcriptional regulator n=1 Tax=Cryptosporangium sp. NPDC048952 TaxID=3363961 RepID=UPI00371547B8
MRSGQGDSAKTDVSVVCMTAMPLARQEIHRENVALRRLVTAYRHLSSLTGQELSLAAVVDTTAARADTTVAVVDDQLSILAVAGPGTPDGDVARRFRDCLRKPQLSHGLALAESTRSATRVSDIDGEPPIVVAPVAVGSAVPAYVLAFDEPSSGLGDFRLFLTEHAASICGTVLGRERSAATASTQVRGDLVEGLLSGRGGDAEQMRRWAAYLGYDQGRSHRVIALTVVGSDEAARRAAAALKQFLAERQPTAVSTVRRHEAVAIVEEDGPAATRSHAVAASCIDHLRSVSADVVVTAGIGGTCRAAGQIAESYDGARKTVEILGRMGRSDVVMALEDLGVHRLLLQVADPAQLRDFVREVFGGVLEHAKGSARDYLPTLACYFRANNSPQRASAELHVHPNTVSYRIRRLEELTQLDFHVYRDRLMAQVALEILDVVGDTL